MAFSVAEDELRAMDVPPLVGHLACWNYFQSIDTPENKKFVADFKAFCEKNKLPGGDDRVTDDPIEAAYYGVYVWKAAAEKAGASTSTRSAQAVYGMEFDAPGGKKKMDDEEPAHLEAGLHRRNPEGRPVQDRLEDQGPGSSRLVQHVPLAGRQQDPRPDGRAEEVIIADWMWGRARLVRPPRLPGRHARGNGGTGFQVSGADAPVGERATRLSVAAEGVGTTWDEIRRGEETGSTRMSRSTCR